MIVRELIARFGVKVDGKGVKKAESSMDRLRKVAAAAGAAFAGVFAARGILKLAGFASDVNENLNVLDSTFGKKLIPTIQEFARITADEVGRSEFEIQRLVAAFGLLTDPIAESKNEALGMSKRLAKLTVDMSSFYNITQQEALEKLRAGLVGSSEPLLQLAIDTRAAAVEQFALSRGISKTAFKALPPAKKAMARYELIVNELAKAEGDAAKTSEGYANASRALSDAVKDIGIRIGQTILPRTRKMVLVLRDLARRTRDWFNENSDIIRQRIDRFFGGIVDAVTHIAQGFIYLGQQMPKTMSALLPVAAIFAFIAAIFGAKAALILAIGFALGVVVEELKALGEGKGVIAGLIKNFQFLKEDLGSTSEAIKKMATDTWDFWAAAAGRAFGLTRIDAEATAKAIRQTFVKMAQDIELALGSFLKATRLPFDLLSPFLESARIERSVAGAIRHQMQVQRGAGVNVNTEVSINQQPGESGEKLAGQVGNEVGRAVEKAVTQSDLEAAQFSFQPGTPGFVGPPFP
jgi:hypothetical protein